VLSSDRSYLQTACMFAEQFATDPSTQNGAVLVDPATGDVVAIGANHFPAGVEENPERWERPIKYSFVEHAERNAIFDAAKAGIATKGLIMYCPWFACSDCARAIIQAGITEVVGHRSPTEATNARWTDSVKVAMTMLDEAGVKTRWITERLFTEGEIVLRRDGKEYTP
jgi:dCMP deaminase